jgi:hypothetical protein
MRHHAHVGRRCPVPPPRHGPHPHPAFVLDDVMWGEYLFRSLAGSAPQA